MLRVVIRKSLPAKPPGWARAPSRTGGFETQYGIGNAFIAIPKEEWDGINGLSTFHMNCAVHQALSLAVGSSLLTPDCSLNQSIYHD